MTKRAGSQPAKISLVPPILSHDAFNEITVTNRTIPAGMAHHPGAAAAVAGVNELNSNAALLEGIHAGAPLTIPGLPMAFPPSVSASGAHGFGESRGEAPNNSAAPGNSAGQNQGNSAGLSNSANSPRRSSDNNSSVPAPASAPSAAGGAAAFSTSGAIPSVGLSTLIGSAVVSPANASSRSPSPAATPTPFVSRTRSYAFVVDEAGLPIEIGAGRFAKAYLGEERWIHSKTAFRRPVAIKVLQKGVSSDDRLRFALEKEILEQVQGHPHIIELIASGEADNPHFVPPVLRDKVENDFLVLELMDLSLEERLRGPRRQSQRDDLLALSFRQRMFRVLDYMVPVCSAIEYAHRIRQTCHRDIKPGNVLLKLPDDNLAGSQLIVKIADFNVGKMSDPAVERGLTRSQPVPGTQYFQSPEQETNAIELLVNVTRGSTEVDYFEDFYTDIAANDTFSVFNCSETYPIVQADRVRRKLILAMPYAESSESNVRGKVSKSVGRAADIYSLGAMFYYLVSGAYANPRGLYDSFRKFVEYERKDNNNTIAAYLQHEYGRVESMPSLKNEDTISDISPDDRYFSYKHLLDGNGELIDQNVMYIIARAMIRNKPDSYCQSWDVNTEGSTTLVRDLLDLYAQMGVEPSLRSMTFHTSSLVKKRRFGRWLSRFLPRRR